MSMALDEFLKQWGEAKKFDAKLSDDVYDMKRVKFVYDCCEDIKSCLQGEYDIKVKIGEHFKFFAAIGIEGKNITVVNPKLFMSILKKADNYEFYNKLHGTIYMSVGYYGMIKGDDGIPITERFLDQLDLNEEQIDELNVGQKIAYADIVLDRYGESSEEFYRRNFDLDDGRYVIQFAMSTSYNLELDFLTLIGMCDRFVVRQTDETREAEDGDVAEFEFTFRGQLR